jgi:hypothetical protein
VIGHAGVDETEVVVMADKSPHRSKDKKKGKSLVEKRAAKRLKRSQREADSEARERAAGR